MTDRTGSPRTDHAAAVGADASGASVRRVHTMPFGAEPGPDRTRFRLWAPGAAQVELGLGEGASTRWRRLTGTRDGWYEALAARAPAGTRYRYRIDGELEVPDPASRYNPGDVHGASEVVDPRSFAWTDGQWRGRPWHEASIYELHVGTFSPEGTFRGVEQRLDHLVDLGVTALELMPLADFPGRHNWGYDGVLPYAPDARYGTPDDLKSLVAAAHARGLMVFVDVVYNHFGPDGNYLPRIAPGFFTDRHRTPWGAGLNFDGPDAHVVRDFFVHNALYWLDEFHVDGLRLDAVHAILDDSEPDLLTELARAVHAGPGRTRHVHLVLENDRNEARRLARDEARRPLSYTAQWNDDLHHVVHHLLTGEAAGYYADYADDPLARLGRCLAEGFAYQADPSRFRNGEPRGEPSAHLPPEAFVNFVQNHDQVGNRAFGERLHALASAGALRGALAAVLLAPSPPLLFMGEEFGADTPFLFFCDFGGDLARAVREGRRAEFAGFPPFDDAAKAETIPDPGDPRTHAQSRLDWDSVGRAPHDGWLAFYRALLARRMTSIVPLVPRVVPGGARYEVRDGTLTVRWPLDDAGALVLVTRPGPGPWPAARASAATIFETSPDAAGWRTRWSLERASG
jgi:maltooligosyltrehalose trehalohydrolase